MPAWETHIVTANILIRKIKAKKDEFIFGNVMPDILNGHLVKDISKIQSYKYTHYTYEANINEIEIPMPDVEKFKTEYKEKMNNPVIFGYFIHLLTDYFWNYYAYKSYFKMIDKKSNLVEIKLIDNSYKILPWDDAVKEKQRDFRIFAKYLQSKLDLNINIDVNKMLEYSKEIKEIELTKQDIYGTYNYIKDIKQKIIQDENYEIFTQEELEKKLQDSIDFILDNLQFT